MRRVTLCVIVCLFFLPAMLFAQLADNSCFTADFESSESWKKVHSEWNFWVEKGSIPVELDTKIFHSGKKSVRVESNGDVRWALSPNKPIVLKPGENYLATVWVKVASDQFEPIVELAVRGTTKQGRATISKSCGSLGKADGEHWQQLRAYFTVPENCTDIFPTINAKTYPGTVWIDDYELFLYTPETQARKPVKGYAKERIKEKLNRGLVAIKSDNGTYLSWRLLESDPKNTVFTVTKVKDGKTTLFEVDDTTDFFDAEPFDAKSKYSVNDSEYISPAEKPYISIPLDGVKSFQRVGIADLDGDGELDYVLKTPNSNIDPYQRYWKPSPGTYVLHAYSSKGKCLWTYDLGWGIEQGIWYSPMLVADLDGDGKAEVALKTSIGDPRSPDGRVHVSQEYLSILDGQTGKERTKIDWLERFDLNVSYVNRNQLCVAYLDGKTPCLIALRGTYNLMQARAYQFQNNKLEELWRWDNAWLPMNSWGQGAHTTHAVDLDGDGRDEIVLGSIVLDDDGSVLWTTGLGHPDHVYVSDIDPSRPGLEIYYGIERAQPKNAICLVDAKTGSIIWGLDEKSIHIHSTGMCSDIDGETPGCEMFSGERDFPEKRWLHGAKGGILDETPIPNTLSPMSVHWTESPQRQLLVGDKIQHFPSRELATPTKIEGKVIQVIDLFGDWREEIITSLPNELRIYTTTIPAKNRRVTFLQDANYRATVYESAMGYIQIPLPTLP